MPKIVIGLENPISFYPQLARLFGSPEAAIYFQQLYYWSDKGVRSDGYIYKTKEEIEQETCLSRDRQDAIRKKLVKLGVLKTKLHRANGSPTLHYFIDAQRTNELLGLVVIETRLVENPLIETSKIHESKRVKSTKHLTETTNRDYSNEVIYRERLQESKKRIGSPKTPDDIVVTKAFQAKAQYVSRRLSTPEGDLTSVLKACRDYTPAQIDTALSQAIDATVGNRTKVFFKVLSTFEKPVERVIYTDAGTKFNGQPGQLSRICVHDGAHVVTDELVGNRTNNEAEILAIGEAVKVAGEEPALIRSDSKLAVNLILGRWKGKEPRLKALASAVSLPACVRLEWIPRDKNLAGQYLERTYRI